MQIIYKVQENDTINTIATAFNARVSDIKNINQLQDITIGQRLIIESYDGIRYRVMPHDTIEKIASRFNTTTDQIIEDNELYLYKCIFIGQILYINKN